MKFSTPQSFREAAGSQQGLLGFESRKAKYLHVLGVKGFARRKRRKEEGNELEICLRLNIS